MDLLRRRLDATEQKQERLRDVYIYRAAIDQATFETESSKLSDERRDIERAIGALSGPRIENAEATVSSALEILSDLLGSWNSAKGQARSRFQHLIYPWTCCALCRCTGVRSTASAACCWTVCIRIPPL